VRGRTGRRLGIEDGSVSRGSTAVGGAISHVQIGLICFKSQLVNWRQLAPLCGWPSLSRPPVEVRGAPALRGLRGVGRLQESWGQCGGKEAGSPSSTQRPHGLGVGPKFLAFLARDVPKSHVLQSEARPGDPPGQPRERSSGPALPATCQELSWGRGPTPS